jgi:uncharacterized protein YecE (DUF72 family)
MDSPLRIGTAGWNIPSRYKQDIPDGGSHLERYAGYLNAVEINSSFYRPHQRRTYERWAGATPDGFRFSVKMPKTISHEHRLKDSEPLLERFLDEACGLGDKLGVMLLQLPPKFSFDERVAGEFFESVKARTKIPVALEPRHASWFTPQVNDWLAEQKIARVSADPAPMQDAGEPGGWQRLVYYRWHGSPKIYYSDYEPDALGSLKGRLDTSRSRGAETWCIFDNTALGAALGNALSIKARDQAGL